MAADEFVLSTKFRDIRFEFDGFFHLFDSISAQHIDRGANLLVIATKCRTRIIGHPSSHELQILHSKDKSHMTQIKYDLRGTPNVLSLNCEEDVLAVNCTVNGVSFVDVFSIDLLKFGEGLHLLKSFRFDCTANQILWNPLVSNLLAICLVDGSLTICFFETEKELKTIERYKTRCACWSSRGNEIIVALQNGVLRQYELEKCTIKTIHSPSGLFDGPYEPIALQWLSSDQFAVVFLENASNARPKLYIVNMSEEQPSYTRFDDTFYSPGAQSVYLIYMPKWNLILTGSKNDARINILVADETMETRSWAQLNFVDESRTRLPLPIEDDGPLFMLDIALENQTEKTEEETPLIIAILTSGLLVTVKFMLSKTMAADMSDTESASESAGKPDQSRSIAPAVSQPNGSAKESVQPAILNSEPTSTVETSAQEIDESHPYVCDICGKRYIWKNGIAKHMQTVHVQNYLKPTTKSEADKPNDIRPAISQVAAKVIQEKKSSPKPKAVQNLRNSETHPYVCNDCGERYKHIGRLMHHQMCDHSENLTVRVGITRKPLTEQDNSRYKCECSYRTNESGNFHRHQRSCKVAKEHLSSTKLS